eukprot:scaffold184_cov125-Cylindrotheca_fusiformis.AAC.5
MKNDYNSQSPSGSDSTLVSVKGKGMKQAVVDRSTVKELEQRNESESEPVKPVKHVTFKNSLKLRKIASHRKYTREEHKASWYSRSECKKLRDAASKTSKKMEKGVNVDKDGKDCSRGLEFKSAESHKLRQTKRLDIIWTVLGEQDDMIEREEDIDHEKIAKIYTMCSRQCVKEARERGLEDEAAVRIPKVARPEPPSHPLFNNNKKTEDIMSLVSRLSMQATMTIKNTRQP